MSYMECTQRVTLVPFTDSNEYFSFLRRSSSSSYFLLSVVAPFVVGLLSWSGMATEAEEQKIYYIYNNNITQHHYTSYE